MKTITKEDVYKKLGDLVCTVNMDTSRGGIARDQAVTFNDGTVVLGSDYNYSNTTNKYRCEFLGEHIKETRAKLDAGIYLFILWETIK